MINNMKKNKIFILLYLFVVLTGCQSVKDAVSGKKSNNADEFLVEKKSSLVMPPNFDKLPKPQDETIDEKETENSEIKDLIVIKSNKIDKNRKIKKSSEKFILDQIKKD